MYCTVVVSGGDLCIILSHISSIKCRFRYCLKQCVLQPLALLGCLHHVGPTHAIAATAAAIGIGRHRRRRRRREHHLNHRHRQYLTLFKFSRQRASRDRCGRRGPLPGAHVERVPTRSILSTTITATQHNDLGAQTSSSAAISIDPL